MPSGSASPIAKLCATWSAHVQSCARSSTQTTTARGPASPLRLRPTSADRPGDARLLDRLRREELIPLGSRIRTRLATETATREELLACLDHLIERAGNATLMTRELKHTLVDHAAGNYRVFITMAGELLMSAAQREITTLDEKLYLQVFAR